MKGFYGLLISVFLLAGCQTNGNLPEGDYAVVPLPQNIRLSDEESFVLSPSAVIEYPEGEKELEEIAGYLAERISEVLGEEPEVSSSVSGMPEGASRIRLSVSPDRFGKGKAEAYRMEVSEKEIRIEGSTAAGVFYACQTLYKSLPLQKSPEIALPAGTVEDEPRFAWRGAHLDVGRHFFPVEFIKKYIDILALHHINIFHWHLTDDQGWRIEIRKYPRLTEVGAHRKQSLTAGKPDGKPYGGFYTQAEVRKIVDYAARKYVTVVPEIDLPGHTSAVLASYPELGCTGGPYEVPAEYGVHKEVLCIGNPQTLAFAKDVLAEIIALFPSRYIHVGGDECPRDRWRECPKCQALIQKNKWRDGADFPKEARLQSYFMHEIADFVHRQGRQVVGWDEIMEGGLAPGATVMAWRNTENGIRAAEAGHDVVMAPAGTLYFSADNLLNLGGDRGLKHVYDFEPAPDTLPSAVRNHIIGTQACLWSERITEPEDAEYKLLPRIAALAEVAWTDAGEKDFSGFMQRLYKLCFLYDRLGYTYSKHAFQITEHCVADTVNGNLEITLSTIGNRPIFYTLDGGMPEFSSRKYDAPLRISESTCLKARVLAGKDTSELFTEAIEVNKATFKPAVLRHAPHENYSFQGVTTLLDGLRGTENYNTGRWLGFFDCDMDLTVDLRKMTSFSSVAVSTNVSKGAAVMGAAGLAVFASDDGKSFRPVAQKPIPVLGEADADGIYEHRIEFPATEARYVRIVARKTPELPGWHLWRGTGAFLFVDEVEIR